MHHRERRGNNLPLGYHFATAARRISYPSETPDNGERRGWKRGRERGRGMGRREALSPRERETRTSAPPPRNIIAPAPFPRADWKLSLPRNYLCSIARADISRKRGRVAAQKLFDCVSQSGRNQRRDRESYANVPRDTRTRHATRIEAAYGSHLIVSRSFSALSLPPLSLFLCFFLL